MIDVLLVFAIIAAIIAIGFLGEIVFEKTRVPDVLFLLLIGIIAGASTQITSQTFDPWASIFTTFTLVFMLFQSSLSISFSKLFSSLRQATVLTILSFVITAAVVTVGAILLLKLSFLSSLLLGMILGGTSSAVIIPMVKGLKLPEKYGLVLTLESAISDVFCIVGSITVISILTTGTLSSSSVFNTILSSFALALLIGAVAGILWAYVLARFPRVNSSYMLTIAVVMSVYAFIESPFVSASGAIGAMVFGLMLRNAKPLLHALKNAGLKIKDEDIKKNVLSQSALNFYSEIGFFVKVFFFVYLGLLLDFSKPLVFVFGALFVLVIYLARPLAVALSFLKEKRDPVSNVALQVLIPKGLAAAVLAQFALQAQVPGAEVIASTVLSVILLSILLTSILIFLNRQKKFFGFYSWLHR